MEKQNQKTFFSLINTTLIILVLYNIIYWISRGDFFLPLFYADIARHWKLFMFLEFLAVVSAAVDIIVRFDQFEAKYRKPRLAISAVLGISFMAKFLLGIIELYMRGEIRP